MVPLPPYEFFHNSSVWKPSQKLGIPRSPNWSATPLLFLTPGGPKCPGTKKNPKAAPKPGLSLNRAFWASGKVIPSSTPKKRSPDCASGHLPLRSTMAPERAAAPAIPAPKKPSKKVMKQKELLENPCDEEKQPFLTCPRVWWTDVFFCINGIYLL